jgi:hypothetical protein
MSFNYQPNYMQLIKALQSGGIEGASQAKQARATRGLGGRRIMDTQKVTDSEAKSLSETMLSYFSDIDEQNNAAKAKSQAQRELVESLGGEVDPVTGETTKKLSLTEKLYGKQGVQEGQPAPQSYFNFEIVDRPFKGNSRKAGDISKEQQEEIMKMIISTGRQEGMSNREIALTLATVRFESGFNPDAAAKTSSASGLGQFINETGSKYGLTDENRWDVSMQVQAVVDHTADNIEMARKKGYSEDYVYALHHDGPKLDSGGLKKSRQQVMPYVNLYEKMLENY